MTVLIRISSSLSRNYGSPMTKNPSTLLSPARGLFSIIRSVENSGSKYPSLNRSRISFAWRPSRDTEGWDRMSLCHQGLEVKLTDTAVTISVSAAEPLLALANALDWCRIAHLAIPDLKRTTKGCWYLGRRLSLRSHLTVMILQSLLKETDRGMEKRIHHTPVLQVFCCKSVLPNWRCPDHTKIEELRNRLTPETHRAIGDYVLRVAHGFGFADASPMPPGWMWTAPSRRPISAIPPTAS